MGFGIGYPLSARKRIRTRRWGLALLAAGACMHAQIITSIAGTRFVFPRQALPATSAPLGFVSGVTTDRNGNVYQSDSTACLVSKVDTSGTLSIVAGNGICGFSGDGGSAINASLNPGGGGLATDSAGNLYIADQMNNRVRKVNPSGTITTIAGGGFSALGDGGAAISASLIYPVGLAVDSASNLYVADQLHHRIREITPAGIISTVAGNGVPDFSGDKGPAKSASLSYPAGIAVDSPGNLIIADRVNSRVRRVTPQGIISTIAGDGTYMDCPTAGPATLSTVAHPDGVAVDSSGNIFVAISGCSLVARISSAGNIAIFAGTNTLQQGFSGDGGAAAAAQLSSPVAVAVDSTGALIIADTLNLRVRRVSQGQINTIAGNGIFSFSGDGGPATAASLFAPTSLALDSSGNILTVDTNNYRVRRVNRLGIISTLAGTGVFEGGDVGDGGQAANVPLFPAGGVAVDGIGNVYIGDGLWVRKVSTSGIITTYAGGGSSLGDGGAATKAFIDISDLAIDSAGNLYIGDVSNLRVRRVSPSGIITTIAGNGVRGSSGDGGPATAASLNGGNGLRLAVDTAGNVYIADPAVGKVRKVSANGIIMTVAGGGRGPLAGDGGRWVGSREVIIIPRTQNNLTNHASRQRTIPIKLQLIPPTGRQARLRLQEHRLDERKTR